MKLCKSQRLHSGMSRSSLVKYLPWEDGYEQEYFGEQALRKLLSKKSITVLEKLKKCELGLDLASSSESSDSDSVPWIEKNKELKKAMSGDNDEISNFA